MQKVLDQARMMLGSFEAYAENHPELVDQWAAAIDSYGTVAESYAFACRDTWPHDPPLRPYVMVVNPISLMFLDPADGHVVRGLSWPYFCWLTAKRLTDIMHMHFFWYAGDGMKIEERLKDPRPIRRAECEGWILLSDAAEPMIESIAEYVRIAGVPADRFDISAS